MSVREYIGARYVPVFADPIQWDPTLVYEPLTVVTDQGASYVSRRMVPEGIQLDNTDYWVLWADFNAQLQHYIDEVDAFDGRIDDLEDALPIADYSSLSTVSDAISAISTKFPVATTDIADDAVTAAKIDDGAVGTAALADDAVTAAKIDDGAVGTAALADDAVTAAKIDDGAVTRDAIDVGLRTFITSGNFIKPLTLGVIAYDYANGMQDHPGAICDIEGDQVIISTDMTNPDANGGHWRTINIGSNIDNHAAALSRTLYHANSIAYDKKNNRVFIAPVFDHSSGDDVAIDTLLIYSVLGTYQSTIQAPSQVMGVSYDYVTQKLYAYCYDGNVYEIDASNNFTLVKNIGAATTRFNQDFAVYDNQWFISSPVNYIKTGSLLTGETINEYLVDYHASIGYFTELDGMEFTESGNLLCIGHTNFYGNNSICLVMEIPISGMENTAYGGGRNIPGLTNKSVQLTPASTTLTPATDIKSLEQLNCMFDYYGSAPTISVPNDYVTDTLYLTQRVSDIRMAIASGKTFTISSYVRIDAQFIMIQGQGRIEWAFPIQGQSNHRFVVLESGLRIKSSNAVTRFINSSSNGLMVATGGITNESSMTWLATTPITSNMFGKSGTATLSQIS